MSDIAEWFYNKLTTDATVSGIVGTNVKPDRGNIVNIPLVTYAIIGFDRNTLLKSPVISVRYFNTTRSNVVSLGEAIYSLFDNSQQSVKEVFSNMKIEGINIVNHLVQVWDEENQNWFGLIDIQVDYFDS